MTRTSIALLLAVDLLGCGDSTDPGPNNGGNNGQNNGNNGQNNGNNGQNNGNNGNSGQDNGEPLPMGPFDSLAERPCPPDSVLTYDNFGGPFVLNWCAGCHSAGLPQDARAGATVGVDFDTIDDIRAQSDRMWARAGDQNATMPPSGGPPASDRTLLGEWLACGAPE